MDKRILFTLVFLGTLISTIVVMLVSLAYGQPLLRATFYALATMWIMGIVSQIFIKHLYISIVKPLEASKVETQKTAALKELEMNVEEIESIDSVLNHYAKRG